MKQLTCNKCREAEARMAEAVGLHADAQGRIFDLSTQERPRPWKLRREKQYLYVDDATGAVVCSTGNTGEGQATLARLVEIANLVPSTAAAVDGAFREIIAT